MSGCALYASSRTMVQWFTNFANQVHQRRHKYLPIAQRGKIFKKQPTIPPVACGERGDFHEKMFAFLSWKPGRWQEATKGKNTYSSSLACFVLPTNALTPTLFSLRALSRSRKQARALSLFPQPLRWVDTYSRLIGPVTAPLGTNPVSTPLGEPSIYAAWRAQYLRRLARAQYLRRLGYNALSSLIIL